MPQESHVTIAMVNNAMMIKTTLALKFLVQLESKGVWSQATNGMIDFIDHVNGNCMLKIRIHLETNKDTV